MVEVKMICLIFTKEFFPYHQLLSVIVNDFLICDISVDSHKYRGAKVDSCYLATLCASRKSSEID